MLIRSANQYRKKPNKQDSMQTMLEVELELASKIQERARERGISVCAYLLELIEQQTRESKNINRLSSQERLRLLREWASGHNTNTPLLSDDAINRETIYSGRN